MKKSYPSLYKSAFVIFVLLIPFYSVKSQSKLWNISINTGGDQFGALYAVSANGSNFEQHDIIGVSVFMPVGELVQCTNGKAYGIANRGGRYNNGAIFEYDYNSNIYTKKVDLESIITGVEPEAGMTLAANGKLYGTTTRGGVYGDGVIFEYDFINNVYTKKVELGSGSGFNGFWPGSVLLQASNGKLYGITLRGGTSASANENRGVVFEYDYNSNIYTERIALHDITGDNFGGKSSLMQASNGKIYGITSHGGNTQNSSGIIFEYDYNTNTYSKKFDFDAFNFGGATTPYGILRQAPDGKLYGTASAFSPNGCIFSYDYTSNTYTKLASFPAPTGQLTSFEKSSLSPLTGNGKFLGTVISSGPSNEGIIYEYDYTSNAITVKHNFSAFEGIKPQGSLTLCSNGKFYGTTYNGGFLGGIGGSGTIYEYDYTANTVFAKQSFYMSLENGNTPVGALVYGANNKLYGMNTFGGAYNSGTLFEFDYSSSTYTKKYDFPANEGADFGDENFIVKASNGKIYGITQGFYNKGVLFEYDYLNNVYTKKLDFVDATGYHPTGKMIEVPGGKLYGMTEMGGAFNNGVIFEYDYNTNTYTDKFDFTSQEGGSQSFTLGANGKLYAITITGGTSGFTPAIFEYDYINNIYTRKVEFTAAFVDQPTSPLLAASNGKIYGTAMKPGFPPSAVGVLYEYDYTTNLLTGKYEYTDTARGYRPVGYLFEASNHKIYGTTTKGGTYLRGVVYEYDFNSNIVSAIRSFQPTDFTPPAYSLFVEAPEVNCVTASQPVLTSDVTSICNGLGTTVHLSIQSGQLNNSSAWKWYSDNCGGTVIGTGTNINVSPITTTTYYARGEGGCGTGVCGSITITVNNLPVAGIINNTGSNVLECNTTSINVTATGGLTYSWGHSLGNNANTVITSPGIYTVTVTGAGGCTNTATITVTQGNIAPVLSPISGPTNVCPYVATGTQLTYSVIQDANATSYQWVIPPTVTLISGQGTNSITITINNNFLTNANRLIKVSAQSACGVTPENLFYLLAQFPSTPGLINTSSANICAAITNNSVITYSIPKVTAATSYVWTTQAGTTTITHPNGTGVNDTIVTVSFTTGFSTSAITVQAVNSCGTSGVRSLTLTRNNPVTPGLISGPTNACPYMLPFGSTAVYSVPPIAGNTYNWTLPPGAFYISGNGTNSISFKYPSSFTTGSISVTTSNACGTSAARSLNIVKLNPSAPGAISVVQTAACPNRIYTFSIGALPANATTTTWTSSEGDWDFIQGTATSLTLAFPNYATSGVITVTGLTNCGGSSVPRSLNFSLPACGSGEKNIAKGNTNVKTGTGFEVIAFPNPTNNDFQLQLITTEKQIAVIKISDIQGREVKTVDITPGESPHIGNELKAGIYMVEIRQGNKTKTIRIVKL